MKRLLYLVLVVAMCLGLGATAYAATGGDAVIQPAAFSDIAGHEAEGPLTLLGAMGVFTGDSGLGGAVKPDEPITRAQFCKALVLAIGRGSTAAGLAGLQPTFVDGAAIPTWAWGYVNVAVYMGVINGYADGTFGPNNPVTYAEAVTMLIRAVPGHLAQVGPGLWPYNYIFYGVDNGFTGGVDVGFSTLPCTRGDMARMLVAMMQINKLSGKGEEQPGTAVLSDLEVEEEGGGDYLHSGNLYQGTFLGCSGGVATVRDEHEDYQVGLGDKVWVVGSPEGYPGLMGQPVFLVRNADGGFFVWVTGSSNVVTGILKNPWGDQDKDGKSDCIILADGTTVPYDEEEEDVDGTINHNPGCCLCELHDNGGAEMAITVGEDGLAVNFVATEFDSVYTHQWSENRNGDDTDTNYFFVVAKVGKEASTYKAGDPATWMTIDATCGPAPWDGEGIRVPRDCAVTINGAPATPADLKVDDVIDIAWEWENSVDGYYPPFEIKCWRQVAEGTVVSTATTYPGMVDRITLDLKAGGTKTYVVDWNGTMTALPEKGDVVKYGLDPNGKILALVGYESLTPFGVCLSFIRNGDGTFAGVFDIRGKEVTYKLDDDSVPYCCGYTDVGGNRAAWEEVAELQGYVRLEVNPGTNTVICDDSWTVDYECCLHEVASVDVENGTLTLWDDEDECYYFIDDPDTVVYKVNDDGTKTYIGLEGLKAGDHLWACDCDYPDWGVGCGPVYELTEDGPVF